jgi:hypothetical protein
MPAEGGLLDLTAQIDGGNRADHDKHSPERLGFQHVDSPKIEIPMGKRVRSSRWDDYTGWSREQRP